MNLKRSLVTLLVLFVPLVFLLKASRVGFSKILQVTVSETGIKQEQLTVWAGTHPWLVLWAVAAVFLFCWLMTEKTQEGVAQPVSLRRRLFVFILDVLFSAFVLIPLAPLVPLALEASETERFSWQFNRNFNVPFDGWMWAVSAARAVLLLLYFVYPLARGRPTVGAYLLGVTTTLEGQSASIGFWRALQRVGWEFIGLCLFPLTLKTGLDAEGRTWYDRRSGLKVQQFVKPDATSATPGRAAEPPSQGIALVWYFMFIFLACGAAYWHNLVYPSRHSSYTQNESLQWRIYRYPEFNFSLESPFPLREKVMKPEPGVKRRILLTVDIPEMNVLIEARGLEYSQALPPDALKQFSVFIPAMFKANQQVKDFKCEDRMGTCSGLPAVFLEGTYETAGSLCRLEAVGVILGNRAWMVEIAVVDGPDTKYMADRIVKSLGLEGLGTPGAAR